MAKYLTVESHWDGHKFHEASPRSPAILKKPDDSLPSRTWEPLDERASAAFARIGVQKPVRKKAVALREAIVAHDERTRALEAEQKEFLRWAEDRSTKEHRELEAAREKGGRDDSTRLGIRELLVREYGMYDFKRLERAARMAGHRELRRRQNRPAVVEAHRFVRDLLRLAPRLVAVEAMMKERSSVAFPPFRSRWRGPTADAGNSVLQLLAAVRTLRPHLESLEDSIREVASESLGREEGALARAVARELRGKMKPRHIGLLCAYIGGLGIEIPSRGTRGRHGVPGNDVEVRDLENNFARLIRRL